MTPNQRSEVNNQTNNGANEKWHAGAKGKTADGPMDHTHPAGPATGTSDSHQRTMEQRSAAAGQLEQPGGERPAGESSPGAPQSATPLGTDGGQKGPQTPQSPRAERQGGSMGNRQNATPAATGGGDQTGAAHRQGEPGLHQPNDAAGGLPMSPGGANQLAADQKMDDDTGLSNTVNQRAPNDQGSHQDQQSNVGRRDDMTPD